MLLYIYASVLDDAVVGVKSMCKAVPIRGAEEVLDEDFAIAFEIKRLLEEEYHPGDESLRRLQDRSPQFRLIALRMMQGYDQIRTGS
jgi:hypothetical protein